MLKKILASVSLVIILLLIIATIVLSNVTVNTGIEFNNPINVYVQYKDNSSKKVDNDLKDEIVSLIKQASVQKQLTAFLNGELNKRAEVNTTISTGETLQEPSKYYVRLSYNENQIVKVGNKTFKDGDGKTYSYKELVFSIDEETKDVKVFAVADSTKPNVYYAYYSFDVNYSSVYSLLEANNLNK